MGCGLDLKYDLIVASIVSEVATVEELVVLEVTRVGCEISLKKKTLQIIFMRPKGARVRAGKISYRTFIREAL